MIIPFGCNLNSSKLTIKLPIQTNTNLNIKVFHISDASLDKDLSDPIKHLSEIPTSPLRNSANFSSEAKGSSSSISRRFFNSPYKGLIVRPAAVLGIRTRINNVNLLYAADMWAGNLVP
jgi:hypothetical protein